MKHVTMAAVVALNLFAVGAQAQTPSGRDVMLRGLKATGADTVLPKHQTIRMTGSLSLPAQGLEAPLTQVRSSTNEFRLVISIEGFGEIEQGYADGAGYSINPQTGPVLLDGPQATQAKSSGVWLDSPDNYATITNQGQEKFEGKDAWKIALVSKDSAKSTRYYDVTTGLSLGTVRETATPDGPVSSTTVNTEYKDFGGMKVPTKQIQRVNDMEQIIGVDKLEWDVAAKTEYALPASIAALKKPK